jgi:hypothetical protein
VRIWAPTNTQHSAQQFLLHQPLAWSCRYTIPGAGN